MGGFKHRFSDTCLIHVRSLTIHIVYVLVIILRFETVCKLLPYAINQHYVIVSYHNVEI